MKHKQVSFNQKNKYREEKMFADLVKVLTLMVQGGTLCPHFFGQVFLYGKGSGGSKFLDFS